MYVWCTCTCNSPQTFQNIIMVFVRVNIRRMHVCVVPAAGGGRGHGEQRAYFRRLDSANV